MGWTKLVLRFRRELGRDPAYRDASQGRERVDETPVGSRQALALSTSVVWWKKVAKIGRETSTESNKKFLTYEQLLAFYQFVRTMPKRTLRDARS